MDPLSIVASVTGLLAFTGSVIKIAAEVREAPEEMLDLRTELRNLSAILRSAADVSTRYGVRVEDAPLIDTVQQHLDVCQAAMESIRSHLTDFVRPGTGRRSPIRVLRWTMRRGEIKTLRNRLRDAKAGLQLAVTVLVGYVISRSQSDGEHPM